MGFKPAQLLIMFLGLCLPSAAHAQTEPSPFAAVASIHSGNSLTLTNGTTVSLAGLQVPQPGRKNRGDTVQPDEPLARASMDALARLTQHHPIRLGDVTPAQDRHGRVVAHAYAQNGIWLQEAMLREGLGFVFTHDTAMWPTLTPLLKVEQSARDAAIGIWANPHFRVLDHTEAAQHLQHTRLVQGTVYGVTTVRKRTYINFGKDWRTDFTLSIPAKRLKAVTAGLQLADITELEGKTLLMRGLLFYTNGPSMEATAAQQISILPAP